jgi:hypothetical protein
MLVIATGLYLPYLARRRGAGIHALAGLLLAVPLHHRRLLRRAHPSGENLAFLKKAWTVANRVGSAEGF